MWRLLVVVCVACTATRPKLPLVTTGEASQYVKTGRYAEAVQLCRDFARVYADVTCKTIGLTLEDRPIVALHVSRGSDRPTIYLQGGIHAGEIEGKDAGFWFLRDLLDGKVAPGALDAVDVMFVPVINPDGHERFGPNNRPNQRGPEEMGFRTNAARLNVNRDFVKADSQEMHAILGVVRRHDPIVFVDLHATDGAKFEHDIAVMVGPLAPRADPLEETAQALSAQLMTRLTALGHLPLPFYPSFDKDDDPTSGFSAGEAPLRFSTPYMSMGRSRIGILVETHSWRTYKERVHSTYHLLQALFERAITDAPVWAKAARDADTAELALRGGELPLVYTNGPRVTQLDFRGYAYEVKTSDLTGGTWITYDESKPQIWKVPLRDEVVPKLVTRVPKVGYIIDGGFAAQLAPLLDRHGIRYMRIAGTPRVDVEAFRATKVKFEQPFEGRTRVELTGAWAGEARTLDQGAIFVSLNQPLVRLIVHLMDPAGPDSFAQWGFVTTAFERKEYIEGYVIEDQARQMLDKDPSLRAQFDAAVAADPELAKSPERKRDWFYRRHPAWDDKYNLLPIYRSDRELTGN
ncbi:MAG TPA: M14 family zinc carboxypeptidase [Kofleriaceae bacterium]